MSGGHWDYKNDYACDHWEPIRCRCSGTFSEIREHSGKK